MEADVTPHTDVLDRILNKKGVIKNEKCLCR